MREFDHIGPLCKVIREGRVGGPDLKQIALACGYRGKDQAQMIRRFESGQTILEEDRFMLYVQALRLLPAEAQQLITIYHSFLNKEKDEARLGYYSFKTIAEREHEELTKLTQQLQETPLPGMIVDELLYVHAVNAPFLKLHNVPTIYLHSPLYWHSVATKYHPDPESPVRAAHRGFEEQFFYYEVGRYFTTTSQYLFTQQHKNLTRLLCKFSPHEFQPDWESLITMSRIPRIESSVRAFRYNGKLIEISVTFQLPPVQIDTIIDKENKLEYTLMWFLVQGRDANAIHEDIAKDTAGKPLAFACEYVPDYNDEDWSKLPLFLNPS